jgi:hypothetical protein
VVHARQVCDGQFQEMAERRRVAILGIGLQPRERHVAGLQVIDDERGLAGARGGCDPQGRNTSSVVDATEEPVAPDDVRDSRCCDLREAWR